MRLKLSTIPEAALPLINDKGETIATYNGKTINEVFKFKGRYRINTDTGQYRFDDAWIDIY
jgi:hypothetical protein